MIGNLLWPLLIGVWCLTLLIVVLGINEVYHLRLTAKSSEGVRTSAIEIISTNNAFSRAIKAGDMEILAKDNSLATKLSGNSHDGVLPMRKGRGIQSKMKINHVFLHMVDLHADETKSDLNTMMDIPDRYRRSKKEQRPDMLRPRDIPHSTKVEHSNRAKARTRKIAPKILIRADNGSPRSAVA